MIVSPLLESLKGIRHGFGTRADFPEIRVVTAHQVHGREVLEVGEVDESDLKGFDALVTGEAGLAVAVKTADCLPVLLADPRHRLVAAVHAGWKGTLLGVVRAAIRAMVSKGSLADDLFAALGPRMGGTCYEVGPDVQTLVEKEFPGEDLLLPKGGDDPKWYFDLAKANRLQLIEAGVEERRIDSVDLCTHCRPDLFHSFRRDAEKAGRMINFIARQ